MAFDITTFIMAKEYTIATVTSTVNKQAGQIVTVENEDGQLDAAAIDKLKESNSSTIILDSKVYRLSRIEGSNYKYINTITNGNSTVIHMSELVINADTGEFNTRVIMADASPVTQLREEFDLHNADEIRHITAEERDFWNNKVTAIAEQDGPNYKLHLIKTKEIE